MSKSIACVMGFSLLAFISQAGCTNSSEPTSSKSETLQFGEPFLTSKVSFKTTDNITITGVLDVPASVTGPLPAVIFIHQGGSSKEEWVTTELFQTVVENGMIALAYDVRGHGASGGEGGRALFDDPDRAPRDLQAAITFLESNARVDKNRLAIVGSSIGANLALVGVSRDDFNIKTAVALSGKTSAWVNLAGGDGQIDTLSSVFVIASEGEQNGKRAVWAQEIHDRAKPPRKLEIVEGSSAHGTQVFKDTTELQGSILNWLLTELR